jgi:hypothetical protein
MGSIRWVLRGRLAWTLEGFGFLWRLGFMRSPHRENLYESRCICCYKWVILGAFNSVPIQIDVEERPIEMILVKEFDCEELGKSRISEPWKKIKVQE